MDNPPVDYVAELAAIMARLRGPGGCPWDHEQTHRTLGRYLIEEAHEFLEAVESGSDAQMADELGDVLLQVVFHSQIAREEQRFDLQEVARRCCDKMIRRHPHVFGDADKIDAEGVRRQWEQIKRTEKGHVQESVLTGVPAALPALMRAQAIQKKAASVGFDWDDAAGARAKITEELAEIADAPDPAAAAAELGDLLFAVVNLSRKMGVDAESALRGATAKFSRRFTYIEDEYAARGIDLRAERQTLAALDAAWDRAKAAEKAQGSRQ